MPLSSVATGRSRGEPELVRNASGRPGYLISIPRPSNRAKRIAVTFPMVEQTTTELAAATSSGPAWRGDDVVAIDPPGWSRPMYGDRPEHAGGLRDYELHRPETEWSW